jgi:hypothetical protein
VPPKTTQTWLLWTTCNVHSPEALETGSSKPLNNIRILLSVIQPAFKEAWIKELPEQILEQSPKTTKRSPLCTHHDLAGYTCFTFWQQPIYAASCWWCMLSCSMLRVGQTSWYHINFSFYCYCVIINSTKFNTKTLLGTWHQHCAFFTQQAKHSAFLQYNYDSHQSAVLMNDAGPLQ